MTKCLYPFYGLIVCGLTWMNFAQAALLSGSFSNGDGSTVYDLTALGELDWAYWSSTADPFSGVATNSKSGGTLIGNLTLHNGTTMRGTTADRTVTDVSFSDGASSLSGSVSNIQGVFNNSVNTTGAGISVAVDLPDAATVYHITVWVSGQGIGSASSEFEGLMTASLNSGGAAAYTDTSLVAGSKPKADGYYNFTVSSDVDDDIFNMTYALSDGSGSDNYFSHTIISSVAVSTIPEPASILYFLMGTGLVGFGFFRKPFRKN
ncbi:PEP-CTERM sorting domain-containing protein [Kiritimatiellaeota bacterium B1221]|nr:PEP-CTERM sorting domain-containing protein [Kiritimatiellaeota bacterium B1221]